MRTVRIFRVAPLPAPPPPADGKFLRPGLSDLIRAESRIVRDELARHITPLLDDYVVVRFTFADAPRPALITTLSREMMTRPKRWLRGRATHLANAGAVISAGRLTLRLRRGGMFDNVGFDLEFDMLVVCRKRDVAKVTLVLDPAALKPPHNRFPRCAPVVTVLKDHKALWAALREMWDASGDVSVDPEATEELAKRGGGEASSKLRTVASAALSDIGPRGLSSYVGLARNGGKLVPTRRSNATPDLRQAPSPLVRRSICRGGRGRRFRG